MSWKNDLLKNVTLENALKLQLGRHVYGLAAIAFGLITMLWHQVDSLGGISHPGILVYAVAAVEIVGGFAIQWQKTVKIGALTIGVIFLIFSLFLIPPIIAAPLNYGNWGNFFEEFSIVLGAVFVLAATVQGDREKESRIARVAYMSYGICVISYSLYQLFYLTYTADLVPKWIPPGQMFWAIVTTIAFALAAIGILSDHFALLATVLLTTMFIGFGLLVWLPACIASPYDMSYWFSSAKNLAVAGAAWIVTDFIYKSRFSSMKQPISKPLTVV